MTNKFLKPVVLMLMVFAAALSACSSGDSNGGDEDFDQENEVAGCEDGELKCSDNYVMICNGNFWEKLENCEKLEMVCDSGRCIEEENDGDIEQEMDEEPEFDAEVDEENTEIEKDDTTTPQITSTSPADGTVNVDISFDKIAINFTEEVTDKDVVYQRDVDIYGGCNRAIFSGGLSMDKMQIQLEILYPLEPDMTYQVIIKEGIIKDLAGNPFEGVTFSFTTKADAEGDEDVDCEIYMGDQTAPEVQYSFPSDGEYGVDTDLKDIRIIFTEKIRRINYVPSEKISVTGDGGHKPGLSFDFVNDVNQVTGIEETTLIIGLKESLNNDTEYTVVLLEGLIDVAENPLGEYSMSFSTGEDPNPDGDLDLIEEEVDIEPDEEKEIEGFSSALLKSTRHIFDSCPSETDGDFSYAPYLSTSFVPNNENPLLGELKVMHKGVMYDYLLNDVAVYFEQDIWTITLTEDALADPASGEDCLWDVEFVINYLLEGTYTIVVKSGNGDPDLQTQVTISY